MTRSVETIAADAGERLDVAVAKAAGVTRSRAARLIDAGAVTVNGLAAARSVRLAAGDRVSITVAEEPDEAPAAEDIPVPVVYEDEWLLVVAKPAGLVVHPAPGHPGGTLVNALLARLGKTPPGESQRPGIVHRLDAGTSGLMIVALEESAHERLREMMAAREVTRTYLALVEGSPPANATIDAPIGRSPRHRKRMAVVAGGKEAITEIRRVEVLPETALVEARPRTGRTHQIRVHLAEAGYPIVGDRVYGRDRKLAARLELDRPFLHAAGLSFVHPSTGVPIELSEPLPEDLANALERARRG
ncbi:MAG: RluA family pseudouridine synthase [Actinomycetota bacterium]